MKITAQQAFDKLQKKWAPFGLTKEELKTIKEK